LLTISLFVITGELLKMKTPPPAMALGGLPVPKSRNRPMPPVSRKPSSRSPGWVTCPKTTTEHNKLSVLAWQSEERMHGFPVASMVVTAGPSVDTTLTPPSMRRDSL
jgi:hypothetical protein